MTGDPDVVRQRTTHGWMFTPMEPEEMNRVKAYLADGDPLHLAGTRYVEARAGVLKRMNPKKAPEPPKPDTVTLPIPPGARVELHRSDEAKFVLIVAEDGKVTMGGTAGPDEALAIVHAVMHAMIDAEKDARRDLN